VAGSQALRIGVLALQGDVLEHTKVLRELGCDVCEVRKPEHLEGLNGLVIPGGESGVMDKLARIFGLQEPLREEIARGLPVFGTCAGLIMLAEDLEDALAGQQTLGGLDVTVRRNAFGSQVDSFEATVDVVGVNGPGITAAFIRAPIVSRMGPGVAPIATLEDGRIVGVVQKNVIGVSFHPEITGDDRLHRLFLATVADSNYRAKLTAPA
jgi:pyridoxal 5'-phosphate synthase pdxT subunit